MTIDEKNILWLDMFPTLSYVKKWRLLDIFRGVDIKSSFLHEPEVGKLLNEQEFNKMSQNLDDLTFNEQLYDFKSEGIEFVTIYDERYPSQLKEIENPPLCLYCLGNLQLLNNSCISIVGSRKPTEYGVVVTSDYAKTLSQAGLTVVSGMAIGVDTFAHHSVLDNNGATIAVLAGGFHHVYPVTNFGLFRELKSDNLVITEASPNTQPTQYLFPFRNRIIAGLSMATIVTEAAEKSGSLSTCNYACEFNRKVFAVPGRINAPYSKGCNMLIKSGKANITLAPSDVLEELNIKPQKQKNQAIQLDIKQQIVLDYIKFEKRTFQEIADETKLSVSELNSILLELELDGLVYKLANNSYIMA